MEGAIIFLGFLVSIIVIVVVFSKIQALIGDHSWSCSWYNAGSYSEKLEEAFLLSEITVDLSGDAKRQPSGQRESKG
jgi:hypothetical protein